MKLLFFIPQFSNRGGTERALITIANKLSHNHQVYILCLVKGSLEKLYEINDNIIIEELSYQYKGISQLLRLPVIVKKIKNYIKIYDISIVVSVEVMSAIYTLPLMIFKKILGSKEKHIIWEHFNYTVSLGKKLRVICRKLVARFSDGIIVLTEKDVHLWTENTRVKCPILSINNPSPFPISKKMYNIRSKIIIGVGRLTYQKGFDKLLDLWKKLKENKSLDKDWKLLIIGSGGDEDSLINKIRENNIEGYTKIIPNTNEINYYYENASFFVMTSRYEGLPMTLIEAQSHGLPIVGYDCLTGPSEIISPQSGFLIPYDSEKIFLEKMLELANNDDLRGAMSIVAKEEAKKYSIDTITKKWESFFMKIVL